MIDFFHSLKDSPIQFWKRIQGHEIYIKREDRSFLGFGSKIRRFQGFLHWDKNQPVLVYGSLGSNFLTAFTVLFACNGFRVICLAKTYDSQPSGLNFHLLRKYAHKFHFGSNTYLSKYKEECLKKTPEIQVVPTHAFSKEGQLGYINLWKEIEKNSASQNSFDVLLLDIGSGLSFLSAKKYFYKKDIHVMGISLGESKQSWLQKYEKNLSILGWTKYDLEDIQILSDSILEPLILPKFASSNEESISFLQNEFKESGIPFEPVYSAKSLMNIIADLESIKQNRKSFLGRKILYIHQGGQASWYRKISQESNISLYRSLENI